MLVKPIYVSECAEWILKRHYAHRLPQIVYAFGLFDMGLLRGVCTFGHPPSPHLARGICGDEYADCVLELNRLVVQHEDKNARSYLVSNAIRNLPSGTIVVSYADTERGHVGYIYQACNFIYTGAPVAHDSEYVINGKRTHARTLTSKGITDPMRYAREKGYEIIKPHPKHRYIYFHGSNSFRRGCMRKLRYDILPYPKGDTARYCAEAQIVEQVNIF